MSEHFLAFLVAGLIGAATMWRVTRARGTYPSGWSVGAWAATAALSTGLIPVQTAIPIAAMTMVIGVGLIAPLVGVIAVVVLLATPVIAAQQVWGRWRRRAIAARAAAPTSNGTP
ncbi:MAG: hypothetical protein ACXVFL_19155 [Solirubrobacteraceae bacterium]